MKTNTMKLAGRTLVTIAAAGLFLFTGSPAFAQQNAASPVMSDAIQHCGCDKKEGIEMYVQNIINDAKNRGINCETAKIHVFACITSYCSICKEHPGIMENCIKMGADYFAASPGFCQSSGQLAVTPMF
jgi:TATA-box binding protein (TBP) (component of TFIID and TFIIIB)